MRKEQKKSGSGANANNKTQKCPEMERTAASLEKTRESIEEWKYEPGSREGYGLYRLRKTRRTCFNKTALCQSSTGFADPLHMKL